MFTYLSSSLRRYFHDPQAGLLLLVVALGCLVVFFVGNILAPLLAAVVLAYLLDSLVRSLEKSGVGRLSASVIIFIGFLAVSVLILVILLPLLSQQVSEFSRELPDRVSKIQDFLLELPERYPTLLSETQIQSLFQEIRAAITDLAPDALGFSIASISTLFAGGIYLILVPFMVLFLLKDKSLLIAWALRFFPARRILLTQVWAEMEACLGGYVRGKIYEILIVCLASYLLFFFFGLAYASLLAVLVGLSVIIPYIGAIAVTIPVAGVALTQWGHEPQSYQLILAYTVLQLLDGYVLVPLLFSQIVKLHPVAVVVAILFFAQIGGVWGIVFAIPLATLIKVLIEFWPVQPEAAAELDPAAPSPPEP